jgi:ABC-type hemin transport system ATPase subunit
VSPSYQELEFPAQYGDGSPAAKAAGASALPRAKQVEQVVNRLAAEGWEYVALEMLLRDQVLVMRAGKVIERGSPQQLLCQEGPFWELVQAEQSSQEDPA